MDADKLEKVARLLGPGWKPDSGFMWYANRAQSDGDLLLAILSKAAEMVDIVAIDHDKRSGWDLSLHDPLHIRGHGAGPILLEAAILAFAQLDDTKREKV